MQRLWKKVSGCAVAKLAIFVGVLGLEGESEVKADEDLCKNRCLLIESINENGASKQFFADGGR